MHEQNPMLACGVRLGYLHLPGLFKPAECVPLCEAAAEARAAPDPRPETVPSALCVQLPARRGREGTSPLVAAAHGVGIVRRPSAP